jgi:hypothetical protein
MVKEVNWQGEYGWYRCVYGGGYKERVWCGRVNMVENYVLMHENGK